MNGSQARERVHQLLASDLPAALAVAWTIDDPWYRCQALAMVAAQTPDLKACRKILDAAFAAADETKILNRVVSVASWPLRELARRREFGLASRELSRLLKVIAAEPQPIRRMDGQSSLVQAMLGAPLEVLAEALDAPEATIFAAHGWKRDRTARWFSKQLLAYGEWERGWVVCDSIEKGRVRRRAARELAEKFGPR